MLKTSARIRRLAQETFYTVLLAAAFVAAFSIVQQWSRSSPIERDSRARREIADRPSIQLGKQVVVRGIDLERSSHSLLVLSSPACEFCVRSAPFHKALSDTASKQGLAIYFALPNSKEDLAFLDAAGLNKANVVAWRDVSRRPRRVPLVLLLDRNGGVRGLWEGELRETAQAQLLTAIQSPSTFKMAARRLNSGEPILTEIQLRGFSSAHEVTILNIDEREEYDREHHPDAINIPFAELDLRARRDLRRSHIIAIDCSALSEVVCSLSVEHLRAVGYQSLAVDFGILADEVPAEIRLEN